MNELNRITADEVRAMMPGKNKTDKAAQFMHYIQRRVKAAAVANQNYTDVSCNGYRASIINGAIEELKENGFKTAYDCEYDRLVIMW